MNYLKAIKSIVKFHLLIVLGVSNAYAQACYEGALASTASVGFVNNGDGTLSHTSSNLMWKICSQGQELSAGGGQCVGNVEEKNWQQALQTARDLNQTGGFAGYTDWRLPNIKELASIMELQCVAPVINWSLFPNTPSGIFWSSTPQTSLFYSESAWQADFGYGGLGSSSRQNSFYVRLVRDIGLSEGVSSTPGVER
ncbi:exported hypothetical protein [uncultured Thiomicrorhabdus sp.]